MVTIPEQSLEETTGILLRRIGWKLATAESCTGGLVSHRITNIPGSSDYFLGGVTAYAYEAKERLLGVSHETIIRHGVVSQETVLEMARGIRQVLGAEVGISVSGIAGPGGGLPGKPVGMVWFAVSTPRKERAVCQQFSGNRVEIKAASAQMALELLVEMLDECLDGVD